MAMTDRQQEGLAKLLDRLGDTILALKAVADETKRLIADAVRDDLAQGNVIISQNAAILTEVKVLNKAVESLEKILEGLDRDVERVRSDLTPVRGIPLPVEKEKSSGVAIGPVKMSSKDAAKIGRNLPWIAFGVLLALALVVFGVIVIVKASGMHLTVDEPSASAPAEKPAGTEKP